MVRWHLVGQRDKLGTRHTRWLNLIPGHPTNQDLPRSSDPTFIHNLKYFTPLLGKRSLKWTPAWSSSIRPFGLFLRLGNSVYRITNKKDSKQRCLITSSKPLRDPRSLFTFNFLVSPQIPENISLAHVFLILWSVNTLLLRHVSFWAYVSSFYYQLFPFLISLYLRLDLNKWFLLQISRLCTLNWIVLNAACNH